MSSCATEKKNDVFSLYHPNHDGRSAERISPLSVHVIANLFLPSDGRRYLSSNLEKRLRRHKGGPFRLKKHYASYPSLNEPRKMYSTHTFVPHRYTAGKMVSVDEVADQTRGYVLSRSCDDDCESRGYDGAVSVVLFGLCENGVSFAENTSGRYCCIYARRKPTLPFQKTNCHHSARLRVMKPFFLDIHAVPHSCAHQLPTSAP